MNWTQSTEKRLEGYHIHNKKRVSTFPKQRVSSNVESAYILSNSNWETRITSRKIGIYKEEHLQKKTEFTKDTRFINRDIFYSKILEVAKDQILVKLMLKSGEAKIFQKRIFDSAPVEHLNLRIGDVLKIEVVTFAGERKYLFSKDESFNFSKYEKLDFVPELSDDSIFEVVQVDDDDNF